MQIDIPVLKLKSKLPDVGNSIFYEMTVLARQHAAINLGQGFPGFDPDPELVQQVNKAMLEGHNQYGPLAGMPELREQIALQAEQKYGHVYNPETEITITAGATEALYAVISAIVGPEDEVIVFDPCYDSYVPAIVANGGQPVHIPLTFPDFSIDWDKVKRLVSNKTRAIILNSPHNPSGRLLTDKDIEALRNITHESDMIIISDEVYEHIVYDRKTHLSMARYPDLAARSFVIGSLGKTLHTTGWKVGFCLAPAAFTTELRKFHQYITFCVNTPVQLGMAQYLKQYPTHIAELEKLFTQKRNLFQRVMAGSRFEPIPCQGTYFQLYRYDKISDLPDTEFCKWLIKEHGVAAIPISVFYRDRTDNKVVRFCFAKKDAELELAAERLCKI